jgi:hypothetical protein
MTRPRAFGDLCQLPDGRLFDEIAKGLELTIRNATRYYEAAVLVENSGYRHALEALNVFAEEEAAKFMILLDGVRAPRVHLARQLSWSVSHLGKGIYAAYYNTSPATFREAREFVERQRPSLYLDGPNEVDYIMRNWIVEQREEKLYVDYIASEGDHYWHTPEIYEHFPRFAGAQPAILRIAAALHSSGFADPAALKVIADIWRPVQIVDDLHWMDFRVHNLRTINALTERALLRGSAEEATRVLLNDWLYPLYPLEHTEIKVDRKLLEQERESAWWSEP